MDYSVFDIESDGLLDSATKIHCVSVAKTEGNIVKRWSMTDYDEMRTFFLSEKMIIGHNIIRYDIPLIEKLLGIIPVAEIIVDTLALSWYLFPKRKESGLESWGEELGIPKPVVKDWHNLTPEEYIFRCSEDVRINEQIFKIFSQYLFELYDGDKNSVLRLIGYLRFKLECAREMEEERWKLDVDQTKANLSKLESELSIKMDRLAEVMPKVPVYTVHARPKVMYKKDGSVSALGQKWLDLLSSQGLPDYHIGSLKIKVAEKQGNPGSVTQLKAWLFSLGWEPDVFKQVKEEDDEGHTVIRNIPQISKEGIPELSESVIELIEDNPELEQLDGVFTLRHRIGILAAFLRDVSEDGFLKAQVSGFTNTLRFKHKTVVNLPTAPKMYWKEMRGCLISPDDDHVLCGADVSGLEDTTKRHYMFYFDPEFVKEQMSPDFDAHLDIGVRAELLTEQESEAHKLYEKTDGKEGKSFKQPRAVAKKGNFSCVYGAGPAKLAWGMKISMDRATKFHKSYWERNWSVLAVADACITKEVNGQGWLFNPVSKLWYSLRAFKDRFSTLNQGTGVYCFDIWVRNQRRLGIKICGQFHDEVVSKLRKGLEEEHKTKLLKAMDMTNDELRLNLPLKISIKFGHSYADVH